MDNFGIVGLKLMLRHRLGGRLSAKIRENPLSETSFLLISQVSNKALGIHTDEGGLTSVPSLQW